MQRAFGLADMGTIEVGNVADAVLLDADPLKDIANATKSMPWYFAARC